MSDIDKINIGGLEDWQKGEPVKASKLQQPVNVLKSLSAISPGEQEEVGNQRYQKKMFKVVDLDVDFINCHTWDGNTEGSNIIKVALPFLIRKTPFDGLTRAGITYTYSDNDKRLAVNESDDEENQIIVASYEEGDIIFASRGIFGGTGVYSDAPTNQVSIIWLDDNVDGRFWAQDDSEEEEEAE